MFEQRRRPGGEAGRGDGLRQLNATGRKPTRTLTKPKAKTEKPLTPASLERSALWHLQRRAMTEHELRTALQKKAKRAAAVHGDNDNAAAWIDALVERMRASLLIDDARVATARVASGRARGLSTKKIEMKLRDKGVDVDTAAAAFEHVDGDDGKSAADLDAARVYVRKRRLRDKDPQKALAALARQGFSFSTAKLALQPEAVGDDDI
ncbi:MAG TPA: RecX family transcriptional regulator [Myxococcota bacterium]